MQTFARFILALTMALATTVPAFAQQDRGHGAIYYSPSGHRVGWARSLPDDATADHVARAMCQGGQIDGQSLQASTAGQGGLDATGNVPSLNVVLTDCTRVTKFDSYLNHQCGGFGFSFNGGISQGKHDRSQQRVLNHLSSWPSTFVRCNDDPPTSGLSRFASALGDLAAALGGNHNSGTPSTGPVVPVGPVSGASIAFRDDATSNVSYQLKCTGESAYHNFTIAPGVTQTNDASSWGMSCSQYDVEIQTSLNDGSQTQVHHTLQAGGPYGITAGGNGFDIATNSGQSVMTVTNDTTNSITFTLSATSNGCPNLTQTTLTVAAGNTITHHLGCPQGATLTVSTGTNSDSVAKLYPVSNGASYHLRYDPNLQVITLVTSS